MKIKAYIVFLFITLSMFLVSTTYMYALPLQPTTSCSCNTKNKEEKECCFHHKKENQKKDCSNTCKSTVCHCSNLINIPLFFNLSFYNKKEIDFLKKEWTYLLVYPHEVYLPIWQPPKLS